jgi:tyrosine-protein phosphatase SIW14
MISQVDSCLYRGPRPKPAEFFAIKDKFARIISLEGLAEDRKEADELFPLGVISRPISFSQIYFSGISQSYLEEILQQIDEARKPVLLHCEHGEDRTGLVVAAYRVRRCGWSKYAAMCEALKYGYRNWLNFGLNKTWKYFPDVQP